MLQKCFSRFYETKTDSGAREDTVLCARHAIFVEKVPIS